MRIDPVHPVEVCHSDILEYLLPRGIVLRVWIYGCFCYRFPSIHPSQAPVGSPMAMAEVDEPLAFCIKLEKKKNQGAFQCSNRHIVANQLVVHLAVVGHPYSAYGPNIQASAARQSPTENNGIQRISVESDTGMYRSIIERTGNRGDVIQPSPGVPFYEASPRNFYKDFNLRCVFHENILPGLQRKFLLEIR